MSVDYDFKWSPTLNLNGNFGKTGITISFNKNSNINLENTINISSNDSNLEKISTNTYSLYENDNKNSVSNINNYDISNNLSNISNTCPVPKYTDTVNNENIGKKNHTIHNTGNAILPKDYHSAALLADLSYILPPMYFNDNGSIDRFYSKIEQYKQSYPIHEEFLNNLTILEYSSDYMLVKNDQLWNIDGKIGNACYAVFTGTVPNFNMITAARHLFDDFSILQGQKPPSIYQLEKDIPSMLNRHPECIHNTGIGHSLGGNKAIQLSDIFNAVITFNAGQTPWDIEYLKNILNFTSNKENVIEIRTKGDIVSLGNGTGREVYHINKLWNLTLEGLFNVHAMRNFTDASVETNNSNNTCKIPDDINYEKLLFDISENYIKNKNNLNNDQTLPIQGPPNLGESNQLLPVEGPSIQSESNQVLPVEGPSIQSESNQVSSDNKTELAKTDKKKNTFGSDAANTLTYLNQGLNVAGGIKNWDKLSIHQKNLFIASTMLNQLKNLSIDGLDVACNTILTYLNDKKIRVEQLLTDVCQKYFNVPLNSIKNVINSIVHKGKDLKKSVEILMIEIAALFIPYVNVALIAYQTSEIIKNLSAKTSIIKIGGIPVQRTVSWSFDFKRGWHKKVTLTNELLDINISSRNKNKNNADDAAKEKFENEAKKKVYQVYGIDYEFFSDNIPANRYEKYKKMLHFELNNEFWKDINNLTSEEIEKFEKSMESDEDKTKRIKYKILDKKFSYYDTNKSKDIYHFVCDLETDFQKCKNNTERAMFLYSLFYETGHLKDDQVQFSEFTSYILKLFNINIIQLLTYINHQNNISDKPNKLMSAIKFIGLNELIEKEKEEEAKDFDNFQKELKKRRSDYQNNSLDDFNDKQKNDRQNNQNQYSIEEIRKFAHIRTLKHEISTEFVSHIVSSSITSNFLFSIVYIDKEYLKIKNEGWMYIPNKSYEVTRGCIQSYTSTIVADHISVELNLRKNLLWISDDVFDYLINPNIQLMSSYMVSSIVLMNRKSHKKKNMGQRIFDISEDVLKTNGFNLVNLVDKDTTSYISDNLINLYNSIECGGVKLNTILENTISNCDYLKKIMLDYLGYSSSELVATGAKETYLSCFLGSSMAYTLGIMILSRVVRSIIFPEIRQKFVNFQDLKNIELRNNDIKLLIQNLSNDNVSIQKKKAIKYELQLKGILEYDKIQIQYPKSSQKHSTHCGKDLIF